MCWLRTPRRVLRLLRRCDYCYDQHTAINPSSDHTTNNQTTADGAATCSNNNTSTATTDISICLYISAQTQFCRAGDNWVSWRQSVAGRPHTGPLVCRQLSYGSLSPSVLHLLEFITKTRSDRTNTPSSTPTNTPPSTSTHIPTTGSSDAVLTDRA